MKRTCSTTIGVLIALILFGGCVAYGALNLRMTKVYTVGGVEICVKSDLFGNVWEQGPCPKESAPVDEP